MRQHGSATIWPLTLVLLAWLVTCIASVIVYRPPEPRSHLIPSDQFSADRAEGILATLVGDAIPHPAGSQQNVVVRNRVIKLLESYGYAVEIQTGESDVASKLQNRSAGMERVPLANIIAKRSGSEPGKSIMLVSHYDSVAAGPGACDDAVGTTVLLEIARMISNEPAPPRDLVFLITDGEELGLLGAKLFVDQHPLADQIGMAINLEARGTTGPSCMFETSQMSRWLVPVYAQSGQPKFASSLFYEIYQRMPRDTDFSALRRHGILGYNFAFIGDVRNYHASADNFENADRGSLQHHGDNALGLIRHLQTWDQWDELMAHQSQAKINVKPNSTSQEAVYFDVFGRWIVWWPSNWSIWFCLIAFLGFAISLSQFSRCENDATSEPASAWLNSLRHLAISLLSIGSIMVVGYLIQFAVRQDPRLSNPWPQNPAFILAGYWFAGFAITGALALVFDETLKPSFAWIEFCLLWLLLAAVTALLVPGASHLFVVPVLTASLIGLLGCRFGRPGLVFTMLLTGSVTGLIWLPLERLVYDAVGFKLAIAMLFRISLLSTALLGLLALANSRAKFSFCMVMSILSVGSFVVALLLNHF